MHIHMHMHIGTIRLSKKTCIEMNRTTRTTNSGLRYIYCFTIVLVFSVNVTIDCGVTGEPLIIVPRLVCKHPSSKLFLDWNYAFVN